MAQVLLPSCDLQLQLKERLITIPVHIYVGVTPPLVVVDTRPCSIGAKASLNQIASRNYFVKFILLLRNNIKANDEACGVRRAGAAGLCR